MTAGVNHMAYFRNNENDPESLYAETEEDAAEYDDGFDELAEEEEQAAIPELSPEEKAERTRNRVKLAFGAGNLFGVIAGAVLILILLGLIFSMIHFVITDMSRNFSLFQTNF